MSVLGRKHIAERLGRPVSDPSGLIVAPLASRDMLQEDCVDVHLGNYFIVTRRRHLPIYDVDTPAESYQELLHVPFGESLILPAGESLLGMVYEYLKVPADVSAEVLTRSSYGRLFVTVATATWIHPGFRGCLTLEIINSGGTPVRVFPGMRMAQLVFYEAAGAEQKKATASRLSGRTRPHFPDFTSEVKRLRNLGATFGGSAK